MAEYKLSYPASEINQRLGKVADLSEEITKKVEVATLSSAEYDALEAVDSNTLYMLTDAEDENASTLYVEGGATASISDAFGEAPYVIEFTPDTEGVTASDIEYDGTASGIDATNVQGAIDTLSKEIADLIVTEGTPDTLTWDGNTEGLVSVDGVWFKVSDVAPTYADFANGFSVVVNGAKNDAAADAVSELVFTTSGGLVCFTNLMLVVVPPEMAGVEDAELEMVFPETGTYFAYNDALALVTELTIPGYTGFGKEVINPEKLPEHLQFGESVVHGDTLTWDGNTEGLKYYGEEQGYKLHDTPVTADDIADGYMVVFSFGGEEATVTPTPQDIDGAIILNEANYIVLSIYDESLGEPGIYVIPNTDKQFSMSLTIPGYTGFSTTVVKPIEEKYLPGSVILHVGTNEGDVYLYADSNASERITRSELLEMVQSGRVIYLDCVGLYILVTNIQDSETFASVIVVMGDETGGVMAAAFYTAEYTAP